MGVPNHKDLFELAFYWVLTAMVFTPVAILLMVAGIIQYIEEKLKR